MTTRSARAATPPPACARVDVATSPWSDGAISVIAPIGLDALNDQASLLTRRDRKYVIAPMQLGALLEQLGRSARILEIGPRRVFEYRSVYFDTPALHTYHAAARRRPERFKIRTRCYVDDGACWIEVKHRTRAGVTRKHRRPHDPDRSGLLTDEAVDFVREFDELRGIADELANVVGTTYRRATLVLGSERVTIDTELVCDDLAGRSVTIDDRVLVETKTLGRPGRADQALWRLGCRPTPFSKYAIGAAGLWPDLPTNKWHRTIARYVTAAD